MIIGQELVLLPPKLFFHIVLLLCSLHTQLLTVLLISNYETPKIGFISIVQGEFTFLVEHLILPLRAVCVWAHGQTASALAALLIIHQT